MMTVKRFMSRCCLVAALGLILSGLAFGVSAATAAPASAATAPGHTIATAGTLGTSDSAAGGGGAIDFWKVKLNGGDVLQLQTATSTDANFNFWLFAPGTNDTNFPDAHAFSGNSTFGSKKDVIDLQAPYNGTFILAVCENTSNYVCPPVDSGSGTDPMDSYTFTTALATSVSAATAAKEVRASGAIAGAPALALGHFEAGGANAIDFWKVKLSGGEQVGLHINTSTNANFNFWLFAPGTNDTSFPNARSFAGNSTFGTKKDVINIQAPYNGTFILAVCENTSNYVCPPVDSGSGTDPMDPYTFTPEVVTGISAANAAHETKASPTIGRAPALGLGHFEAGGGNAIDFWKVKLNGGDKVQFQVKTATNGNFNFWIFPPGTNDTNFPGAVGVSGQSTYGTTTSAFTLQVPRTGNYVLAVCENTSNYVCPPVDSGSGTNPMDPYTFTLKQTGGFETRTALKLSAATVKYGHEKGFRFTASVSAIFGGRANGKVVISDGKKALCTAKVVSGKGFCALSSNTKIPAGKYTITGAYTGNRDSSKSGGYALKVTG